MQAFINIGVRLLISLMHPQWPVAVDCSHPPPKMATTENPTSGKAAFDHVAGHGSL